MFHSAGKVDDLRYVIMDLGRYYEIFGLSMRDHFNHQDIGVKHLNIFERVDH